MNAVTTFTPAISPATLNTLAAIAVYARSVTDTNELAGLAARINAARELVKAQDDVRDIRRMLMHAEVAVLTRRAELGDPKLSSWEKLAVKAFERAGTEATDAYVDEHFEEYGKASTLGRALSDEQKAEDSRKRGEEFARSPEQIARWKEHLGRSDPGVSDVAREWAKEEKRESVAETMRALIDGYTYTGEPFTVEDVTDAVIERMGGGYEEAAFRDGVRRVCREAVRTAGAVQFEGELLPKTIAVEHPLGWVRVPLASVTPSHLTAAIREREAQIARDQASVDRLSRLLTAITAQGCGELDPIADYLPRLEEERRS